MDQIPAQASFTTGKRSNTIRKKGGFLMGGVSKTRRISIIKKAPLGVERLGTIVENQKKCRRGDTGIGPQSGPNERVRSEDPVKKKRKKKRTSCSEDHVRLSTTEAGQTYVPRGVPPKRKQKKLGRERMKPRPASKMDSRAGMTGASIRGKGGRTQLCLGNRRRTATWAAKDKNAGPQKQAKERKRAREGTSAKEAILFRNAGLPKYSWGRPDGQRPLQKPKAPPKTSRRKQAHSSTCKKKKGKVVGGRMPPKTTVQGSQKVFRGHGPNVSGGGEKI